MKRIFLLLILLSPMYAEVNNSLTLSVKEKTLLYLCESVAKQCRVGLIAGPLAIGRLEKKVTINARKITWKDATEFFADAYNLKLSVDEKYLMVQWIDDEVEEEQTIEVYNPTLIKYEPTMYPGPKLSIPEPGSDEGNLVTEIEGEQVLNIDDLVDLLDIYLEEDHFEANEVNNIVYVLASEAVHAKIKKALGIIETNALRQMHCRIYDVTDKAAAIKSSVLSAAEWKALQAAKCIGNFTLPDGVRNHFYVGESIDYLSDLDLVGDDYDPVISTIGSGIIIDVAGEMTVDGLLLTVQAVEGRNPVLTENPVQDALGNEITKRQDIKLKMASVQDSRLVPYNGATIIRLGKKVYALECQGELAKSVKILED